MSEVVEKFENIKIKARIDKMHKGGHIKKAVELCQSALKNDPTNADLHISLGDLYLEWHHDIYQSKQYLDEAITEYQRALETHLDSSIIHYKIGLALYYKGELDKAAGHFNLCIEYDSKMADGYFMLARTFAKKERFSESFPNIAKALKYGGVKTSRPHYLLYLLLNSREDRKNIKQKIRANWHLFLAVLTLPFDGNARKELSVKCSYIRFIPLFIKGYYLEKTKNYYKAIELYSQEIERAPGFLPLYILLGDVYRSMGKTSDAINEYRMALWLDPTNIMAYKSLCATYEEQGDYDNAIKMYEKLIEMHPNDAIYYSNLANILYLKGDLKSAISCYQTAITLNPNKNWTSIIAQTLGYVLQESKENYDAAISAYQSAFLLNPNDIDIYISLGSAFYDKGDYNNALAAYRVALESDPGNARIHCNLGYLLWGKGIIDESIKEYELAIKLDPNYDIAYNNLGVIYLDDLGQIQKSMELFQQAIDINSNYALAYYNMGRAMAIKGEKIEAARIFQVALNINSFTNELDNNEIKDRIDNLFD
ncbi:MAG: tetratricopeptide repeat protein [Candidatus Gastranaerophilales bacterium]|nr:tetratricopeptide repeat protein [Candidatus Gastranaerophilales bacterium]